jgi:hypothetical protein
MIPAFLVQHKDVLTFGKRFVFFHEPIMNQKFDLILLTAGRDIGGLWINTRFAIRKSLWEPDWVFVFLVS